MKRLFKFGLLAAAVGGIFKLVATKKQEWSGLTETEVRTKLSDKLGDKVPGDKLEHISDTVVGKMRDKGKLGGEAS